MIIQPKIRGFICLTAHPAGCKKAVEEQIHFVESQKPIVGPKKVLIIGASTGYGLASRIVATFGANAKTIGVFYEKPADEKRTASPGWYNSAAFEAIAMQQGHYAKSINGDAFSDAIKKETAELIRKDFGEVDLVIYSLASPRRVHPKTGEIFSSVLKPIGADFSSKTIDVFKGEIKDVNITPATDAEINATVQVMGGEDWEMWIHYLSEQNLLAQSCKTVAYSYLGSGITDPIYKKGTIGKAKEHLKKTADQLNHFLKPLQGSAVISVDKAVVTQASAAIPVVSLYMSILFKLMKAKGTHEGCIEQIYRLFSQYLYANDPEKLDEEGFIRLDNFEMEADIQAAILESWSQINSDNVNTLADLKGYRDDFYKLFGFNFKDVDYEADVDPYISIQSLEKCDEKF